MAEAGGDGNVTGPISKEDVVDLVGHEKIVRQLHDVEATYRSLVERLPAISYIDALDGLGVTISISPQVQDMLGYTPREWIDDPGLWVRLIHPDDRARVVAEDEGVGDGPFRSEYRMIARDGRTIICLDQAVLIRDGTGRPLYWQGVMFDVTELRSLVREREQLRPILTRGLLHSIATVQGSVEALGDGWSQLDDAERLEIATEVEAETARMRDLADNALAVLEVGTDRRQGGGS